MLYSKLIIFSLVGSLMDLLKSVYCFIKAKDE